MGNPRRTNGSRRDKVTARVKHEERVCHLCGQRVDVTLVHGLPGSPEVDELLPVSLGGSPTDRANCRLAHRHCNRRRWHHPFDAWRKKLHAEPPRFGSDGMIVDEKPKPKTSREW